LNLKYAKVRTVLINDLNAKISQHRKLIDSAVSRVLDRAWLVSGPEVAAFEEEFARYVGVQYCRSLANGTDALELGLRAVGVCTGDRVATVANAGFYTSTAVLAIGAEPFYLDVDPDTQLVSVAEIERAIAAGVRAVVATHLYGRGITAIARIAEICRGAGVALLEDCAQAHGARIDGQMAGSFGDIGCFSFYPTKNLGALGDGGALVTRDEQLAHRAGQFRQYGWSSKYHVELPGARNSRLDEVQAAILRGFLPLLDGWNMRRRQIAIQYSEGIQHPRVALHTIAGEQDVAHLYIVRTKDRQALQAHLKSADIASDVHYPVPDHRQSALKSRFPDVRLPHTEMLAQEILTLPCYPEMTDADVARVIQSINAWPG
jgi:dTDP-4-amino-4,6-dideoxygalactose transaminase